MTFDRERLPVLNIFYLKSLSFIIERCENSFVWDDNGDERIRDKAFRISTSQVSFAGTFFANLIAKSPTHNRESVLAVQSFAIYTSMCNLAER